MAGTVQKHCKPNHRCLGKDKQVTGYSGTGAKSGESFFVKLGYSKANMGKGGAGWGAGGQAEIQKATGISRERPTLRKHWRMPKLSACADAWSQCKPG